MQFINAIVSGKLDGAVYSRNRGGYYMKRFSNPLNPNSQAQNRARTNFGAAATVWHSLTDIQKAQWNSYAETHYTPLAGMLGSPRTGFQAFTALYGATLHGNAVARGATIGLPIGVTFTKLQFTPSQSAPSTSFSAQIKDSNGAPLPFNLVDATLNSANAHLTTTFDLGATQANAPQFRDAIGDEPVGFLIKASRAMTQSQQFVQNRAMTIVGAMQPIDALDNWAAGHQIKFEFTNNDFDISQYKLWFSPGEKVNLEATLIGQTGAQARIGAVTITVI